MKIGIIVCAAGLGIRVGGPVSKQFIKIGKKRVIDYTLENILNSKVFDDILLMIRPGDDKEYLEYVNKGIHVAYGDINNGQNTRRIGLNIMYETLSYGDDDIVGVADGNRPFITPGFYRRLVEVAKQFGNAIPYISQREILVLNDGRKTLGTGWSRNDLKATMAPCFLPFGMYRDLFNNAHRRGDLKYSEGVVRLVVKKLEDEGRTDWLHFVKGDTIFFKITTPDDVDMAKLIMKGMEQEEVPEQKQKRKRFKL